MACKEDMDFHDDNNKVVEKAKESILLMKKKMFLSHDLILQYNNKLKECDRLKGDLCAAQEEEAKLKRENNANLSKVVKLESQIVEWKKSQLGFQQKIADQDVRIASDKCHVQQLICKLENIESIHSEKIMEMDLQKSSMEVKIKELEQELKKLNKSHQAQIQKLEKTMNCTKVKKAAVKNNITVKETIDVGINTEMPKPVKPIKPVTADKIILTDEFYHMKDNPYPIFCDRCELLVTPSVDKICKIMTAHPPLLGEMLSPPRPRVSDKPRELSAPLESTVSHHSQEPLESRINVIAPEIDDLKRKLAILERKMKKRNKDHSRESQPPNGNCCGHSRLANCCNHTSSAVPNVQMPNVQPDFMAEFWSRIMHFTTGSLPKQNTARVQRKNSQKTKLLKLKKRKMKMSMEKKYRCSSTNWEIESDDCQNEVEMTMEDLQSNSDRLHILRLKPSKEIDTPPIKIPRKKSMARASSPVHLDEFTERDEDISNESCNETPIKIGKMSKRSKTFLFDNDAEIGNSSVTNISQVSERRSSSRIKERKKLRSRETEAKKVLSTSEYLSASSEVDLGDQEATRSSRQSALKSQKIASESESRATESAYESQNSQINVSGSICEDSKYIESSVGAVQNSTNDRSLSGSKNLNSTSTNDFHVTENSTNNYSDSEIAMSHNLSHQDEDLSDAQPERYSDADTSECLQSFSVPEKNTRKRKRSNSPKVTKPTSQSKLLRKLRALKKNSIRMAAKGNPLITNDIPACQRTSPHESGTENAAIAAGNESVADASTAKKLRIAHVPKTALANESDITRENFVTEDNKNLHKNRLKSMEDQEKISNTHLSVSVETLAGTNCADDTEGKIPKSSDAQKTILLTSTASSDESDRSKLLSLGSAARSKTLPRTKTKSINRAQAEYSAGSERDELSLSSMGSVPNSTTNARVKSPTIPIPPYEHPADSAASQLLPIDSTPNLATIARTDLTIIGDLQSEHSDDSVTSELLPIESASNLAPIVKPKSMIMDDLRAECSNDFAASNSLTIESASNLATMPSAYPMISAGLKSVHSDDLDELKLSSIESAPNLTTFATITSSIINGLQSEQSDDFEGSKLSAIESDSNVTNAKPQTIVVEKSSVIDGRTDYSADSDKLELSSVGSVSSSAIFTMTKSTIVDGLRTETSKQPDSHPVSPTVLPVSHHQPSMPMRNLPIPPMPSRPSRPIKTIHTTNSDKNDLCKTSQLINDLSKMNQLNQNPFIPKISSLTIPEAPKPGERSTFSGLDSILCKEMKNIPTCLNFPFNTTNPIMSVSATNTSVEQNEFTQNSTNSLLVNESSQGALHDQTLMLPDESPASPDISPFLDDPLPAVWTSTDDETPQSNKVQRHLSIYDQVELPISEKIATASTSSNIIASQTARTERTLLSYDSSMFATHDEGSEYNEPFDSRMISNSPSSFSETDDPIKKNERKNNRHGNLQNIVKDLRTRTVKCGNESAAGQQNQKTIYGPPHDDGISDVPIDPATYQRGIRCLGTLLSRYLVEGKKKSNTKEAKLRKAAALKLHIEAEKVAQTELDNLVTSEIWSSALQADVIAKLHSTCSPRTLSKSIVDFLIEGAKLDEPLDRTYTPPAPVMTKTQQRIVTLINGIERDGRIPGVFEFVMAGINFNLFRMGYHQIEVIEQLARMFTILARMKKDRERVRIMCCDAFYFLGRKVYTVIYNVLSIWPEVFPNHSLQEDVLLNSMVHLLRVDDNGKAVNIRKMLTIYYKYPEHNIQSTNLMTGLMNELTRQYTSVLEAAILLVAKREGTHWTYKNIVNAGLLKIIDDPSYPSLFNALNLLGFLMRVFPFEDEDKAVELVIGKLCKMLNSPEASPDQQEGVVAALLSMSRIYNQFGRIADTIIPWKPSQPMRITTIEQLNVLFKSRAPDWWNNRKVSKAANKTVKTEGIKNVSV